MFQSARLKLTTWYLLIIMLVSVFFSVAMYRALTSELDRVERIHRLRFENRLDPQLIGETKNRLKIILTVINFSILGVSTIAGYFLAGRTLKPISEMVDEQNRFITDASHELRTPLTSLKSEIEVNLRDKNLTLKEAKRLLASNLEEVNNLQILSDDLIELTQYQKVNNYMILKDESLSIIAEDACKKVAGLAKKKNIKITNKIKNILLKTDKQRLIGLFVILLDNAIKYSHNDSNILLTSQKTDHLVIIQIQDEGIGISKENISSLFDRFYRVDKARTKTDVTGYGLGLSIAKKFVDMHKGSIKIESEVGKGTTVIIQLPL